MKTNKLILICVIIAAVGALLCGIGFALGGHVYGVALGQNGVVINSNQNAANGTNYQYVKDSMDLEAFENLDMDIDFADVEIRLSDHFGMEYYLREDRKVTATLNGKTMNIIQNNLSKNGVTLFSVGSVGIGSLSQREYVIVYVPENIVFGKVNVKDDFGDIDMDSIQATEMTVDDSFGKVIMAETVVDKATITLESGDFKVDKLVSDNLYVKNSFGKVTIGTLETNDGEINLESGDLRITSVTGGALSLDNSFGKIVVESANLTGKLYSKAESGDTKYGEIVAANIETRSNFGKIEVEKMTTGDLIIVAESGDCNIDKLQATTADISDKFGSVEIGLSERVNDYTCHFETEFGKVVVNGEDEGEKHTIVNVNASREITINNDSGDIRVSDAK